MPDLIDMGSASPDNGLLTRFIIVAAAFVVVAVLFAVCSVSWSREADPDPAAPAPWLGIGLLPVMLSGLLVFAASFVMQLIFCGEYWSSPVCDAGSPYPSFSQRASFFRAVEFVGEGSPS